MRRRVWSAAATTRARDGGELGVELGVVEGDGELAGDEGDHVDPVGGERAADQPVLQQQDGPERAAAEDRYGQQRAAVEVGEVGSRGRTGRRGWRRPRPAVRARAGRSAAPTSEPRTPGRVHDRCRLPARHGQQPVALVAVQQQVHAGGPGHR